MMNELEIESVNGFTKDFLLHVRKCSALYPIAAFEICLMMSEEHRATCPRVFLPDPATTVQIAL